MEFGQGLQAVPAVEQVGAGELHLARQFEYLDKYGRAVGLPFLLQADSSRVALSEHTDYKWVSLNELKGYNCVPEIRRALFALKLVRGRT